MKRKFAIGALLVAVAGGAWSCYSNAQELIGPARAPRLQTIRTNGQGEVINLLGLDLATGNLASVVNPADISSQDKFATLADLLKTTQGADRDAVVLKLKTAVGEQFDSRQDGKAKELKALEEQLAKLKELHAKRTQQREQIIADRVQQIVKESDGLGWWTSDGSESDLLLRSQAFRPFSKGGGSGYAVEFRDAEPLGLPPRYAAPVPVR